MTAVAPHVKEQVAALIGRGSTQRAAAVESGVHEKTVCAWMRDDDFRALVRRHREAHLDDHPTPRAALEAALHATRPDGLPDWPTRVAAARALLGCKPPDETEPQPERRTTLFRDRLSDGDAV